jgi:hypothetical protein
MVFEQFYHRPTILLCSDKIECPDNWEVIDIQATKEHVEMLSMTYHSRMLIQPPEVALRKFFPSKNAWSILIYGEMNVKEMESYCLQFGYDVVTVEKDGKILDYKACKNCRVFLKETK